MIINMWSGPRNISTAMMRSFENRKDTDVIDEPFYAYYLKKTKLKHPMYKEIIARYETDYNLIIDRITSEINTIVFIKHMTQHINLNSDLSWINKGKNIFLLRDPIKVINSYIKNNDILNSSDIGFPEQLKIFKYIKKNTNSNFIVINADSLLKNPKIILSSVCKKFEIKFDERMLTWKSGKRSSDGIWSKIWYKNVIKSEKFQFLQEKKIEIPSKYNKIYEECLEIYKELNQYSIKT